MAANTSFKQQCPSCEEMVLIKDAKLVGKKVDCPKCKFRFVVEEPKVESDDFEEVTDDEPEEKPAKKPAAKPAAKPASKASIKTSPDAPKKDASKSSGIKKDANGKPAGAAVKKKAKKDDDDEEPEEKRTFKKKKSDGGNNKKVIVAAGIALVAVGLLGVAGYFVFGGGDGPKKTGSGGIPGGPTTSKTGGGETGDEPKGGEDNTPKAAKAELADPSNHLLGGSDLVVNIKMRDLLASPVGRALVDPAQADATKEKLGFGLEDIERLLFARSQKQDWVFVVIRTSSAIKLDGLKKALKLKSGGEPIRGQEYFVTSENWRDKLQAGAPAPANGKTAPARPLSFRLHDPFTLVLGDVAAIKEFLEVEGKPPANESSGIPGVPIGPPPPPPNPNAPGTPARPPAKPYSTVSPRLRLMMDRLEAQPSLLCSIAADMASMAAELPRQSPLTKLNSDYPTEGAGVCLHAEGGVGGTVILECKSAEVAKKIDTNLQFALTAAKAFLTNDKFQVEWKQNDPARPAFPPPPVGTPPEKKEEDPDALTVAFEGPKLNDRLVQLSAKLSPTAFQTLNLTYVQPPIQRYKGELEMAQRQPTPHDLATAARAMANQAKGYPRAAFERQLAPARAGRPYLPNERVSWMAELLPHLGYADVHRSIEFQHSWSDVKNLTPAMTLIPYFIDPSYPINTRYATHPKLEVGVGATHYVGIGGIGADAASYMPGDPAADGKLGAFGYDRTTPLSDAGDHTIIMMQVPPPPKGQVGPWLAGGGATVRGVPETGSIKPFVSTEYNGKRGTYALMSDGSVRFIAEDIADDVLKALAVVKKDKPAPGDNVPKVEKKSELKAGELPGK